ncbi:Late embryogenesis abundant (LEA) hydroxyproline-rich glycoprotein family [Melia azedarach]|uniref:Late embryogenesis abundant (LEA) hydroxyproline-rich glycoprotein family n=2 Tax=Melia azedarach TaxID=155640 RepID=A0ACC1X2H4_MELAZ|nr:Late embryogenesis abundant (LEA) hydroxyproline-rich glycoprotein family [Melia azedarach]KAJ4705386.1 Late embryogenesis abundant (LEA) hydroxyproline-rich glycoprotein family [Melia azedarach]
MATSAEVQTNKPPVVTGYPVAYAYAVPQPQPQPQPQVVPAYYENSYPNRRERSTLLCRLILFVIVILAIMGLASFIMWLIIRPKLPEFRVDSASISQLNATSTNSSLTATWKFSLSVKNPNSKLDVSYNPLEASVLYGEWELDKTLLAPFSQGKGNETRVDFPLAVVSEYVGEGVVSGIRSEKARGEVEFGVEIYGWVRFTAGWWSMRWHYMRVSCDGVRIGVSNDGGTAGNLVGRVNPCRVYI